MSGPPGQVLGAGARRLMERFAIPCKEAAKFSSHFSDPKNVKAKAAAASRTPLTAPARVSIEPIRATNATPTTSASSEPNGLTLWRGAFSWSVCLASVGMEPV